MRLFTLVLMLVLGVLQQQLWFGKNGLVEYRQTSDNVLRQQADNQQLKERNEMLYKEIDDLKSGLEAIEPIQTLKTNYLGGKNPRLHTDEILIALSSSAAQNPTAAAALKQLSHLKGCDMHSTVILSSVDMDTVKKLGMYLTCEPTYEEADRMYHKK